MDFGRFGFVISSTRRAIGFGPGDGGFEDRKLLLSHDSNEVSRGPCCDTARRGFVARACFLAARSPSFLIVHSYDDQFA